jgi:hypothetical protein
VCVNVYLPSANSCACVHEGASIIDIPSYSPQRITRKKGYQ